MTTRRYRFDDFELDAATRELRHANGQVTLLPARIFDCVVHLIEQRARAVGRDELVAVIWNQADIGDNVLAQLLARTRKVLEDTGEEQRIIRTIPGFGYHWIAPTRTVNATAETAIAAVAPAPASADIPERTAPMAAGTAGRKRAARLAWRIGAALAVVLLAAVVAIGLRRSQPPAPPGAATAPVTPLPPLAGRPALVLPALVDPAGGHDWLRLGIMALVGERLAAAGQATVPSDNVVALTRGLDIATLDAKAHAQLADLAVANAIIQPRVEAIGARWRVSLAIVHGQVPIHLVVTADADQVLDAAREAADRLSVSLGTQMAAMPPGIDDALALVLKRAESAYLDGKPEAARKLLADAQAQHPESTELSYQLAWMEYVTGQLDAAQKRLETLAAGLSAQDDPVALGRAYNVLANIHYQHRDLAGVARYSQQAMDLLQERPDGVRELGQALREQAVLASAQGHYEDGLAKAARARVLLAAAGDWLRVARVDSLTGITLHRTGRLHESVALLERTADRLQQFQDAWLEGVVRSHIAATELTLAEPAAALRQESRMRELDQRIEHPGMRAAMKLALGEVLIANGRLSEARELIVPAYEQILAKDDRLNAYFAHASAARLAMAVGEPDRAEREAAQAIAALYDPEEDERHVAWTSTLLIGLQARHDPAAAEAAWQAMAKRTGEHNPRNAQLYLHLARAEIATAGGDAASARAAFEQAMALADAAPIDLLRTAQAYVPWLLARDEHDRAAEIVGRLGDLPYRNFDAAVLELRLYRAAGQQAAWQGALDRAQSLAGERAIPSELRGAAPAAAPR